MTKYACLFIVKFSKKHFTLFFRNQREMEFMILAQENRKEHEAEFTKLSRYVFHLINDENSMAQMFKKILEPQIRHKVALFDSLTIEEACTYS